jgi:mRNA interferase RelE/StbE
MPAFRIEIGKRADAQLAALDTVIGAGVERRIQWLSENAGAMVHRRLVGMPEDLAGLCKLRIGDWRILYWVYPAHELIRVYRIQHRSEVYRDF